jgi:hypothetical protein
MSEDQVDTSPNGNQLRGLRSRAKRALILDLAAGDERHEAVAKKHGMSYQGIANFAGEYDLRAGRYLADR